jgi:hypothetical protein
MVCIAHRGNTNGPNPTRENTRAYIEEALLKGFDVEIDVWGVEGRLFLGHDKGLEPISTEYLHENFDHLWVHCKNVEAIDLIHAHTPRTKYFWHQTDDYTLTSNGYVWCYPGMAMPKSRGIMVMPEVLVTLDVICEFAQTNLYAICSDLVEGVRKNHK